MTSRKLPALTTLRFFAALWVVLFHFSPAYDYPGLLNRFIAQGRSGVAFFFVLSGFILTYSYINWFDKGPGRFREFYAQRIGRIYPMTLLTFLIATVLTVWLAQTSEVFRAHLPGDGATRVMSWLVSLLTLQAFVPRADVQYLWNQPSWSIGAEFFFYALFPFLLRHFARWDTRKLVIAATAVLALQAATWSALTLWIASTQSGQPYDDAMDLFVYKFPFMRLPEFVIGCIGGLVFVRHRVVLAGQSAARRFGMLLGLLGIVAVVLLPVPAAWALVLYPMKFYVLFTPVFGLLIPLLAADETVHKWVGNRFLVALGDASFSMYLIHGLGRIVWVEAAGDVHYPLWTLGVGLAVLFAVSLGAARWIEPPARRWLSIRLVTNDAVAAHPRSHAFAEQNAVRA